MESSDEAPAPPSPPSPPRRRVLSLLIVAAGAILTVVLAGKGPRDQHVRFVLGPRAADVTGLDVQYATEAGEPAREAHLTFALGAAPRVVSHEPSLPDGAYRLRIDVDSREGRRSAERQVTLGGGTTSVDLSRVLESPP